MADEGFTALGDTLRRAVATDLWVDPQQERALVTDVQAQLTALPATCPDVATYERIVESLPLLKRAEDKVVAFFKDMKAAAYEAHKRITQKEAAQLQPIVEARKRMGTLKYEFEKAQEQIRREQERALAEQERQRLEDLALAEAALMEDHDPVIAQQMLAEALAAPPPTVVLPSATAHVAVKGVAKSRPRWVWRYAGARDEETPFASLPPDVRTRIVANMPKEWLVPNELAISAAVKAQHGNVKIPGVEVFDVGTTAVRG